jgi:hypothetical protein
MRKTIGAFVLLVMGIAYTSAYGLTEEKLTISTYYPAPNGVYQTMRLKPSLDPPSNPNPGQLYYNITDDFIYYCNATGQWMNLVGGGGGVDPWLLNGTAPGVPKTAQIYFNSTVNTVHYYNNTSKSVNVTVAGYWKEKRDTGHFDVSLANGTGRRVAFGARQVSETLDPTSTFQVHADDNSTLDNEKVATFSKFLTDRLTSQKLFISLFPGGAPSYLVNTSVISVPSGHLKLAVANATRSMYFNVASSSAAPSSAEVMRISNPTGETYPANYRVVIGNTSASFPVTVDTKHHEYNQDAAFAVRGTQNGRKTGTFTVSNWGWTADWSFGCTFENGNWMMDPYTMTDGSTNHYYIKFLQSRFGSAEWFAGSTVFTKASIAWSGGAGGFDKAFNGGNGVTLWDDNGQWVGPSCSRTIKENFVPIDLEKVLQNIEQLEVPKWNYIGQNSVTHIGPMAEDFHKLFKLGRENEILDVDALGISLAGVKALIRKANAQQNQIEEMQRRVAALQSQLTGRLTRPLK